MTEPDLRTEETEAKLAERLRALAVSVSTEPGGDSTTAKFIFDMRAAAGALDDLEAFVQLVLVDMAAATNADLAADGPVGDEEGEVWKRIEALAEEVRARLAAANPEPKVA